jgi:hypothetical protein
VGYFCHFSKKLPKVNNDSLGENWPNLVTLVSDANAEKMNGEDAKS